MPDTILRKKRPFVGRKDLIAAFRDAVKTKKPDEHKVLVFHGAPGIGKSALQKKLSGDLTEIDPDAKWAALDFDMSSYRDMETALFWLRKRLKGKYKIKFPAFDIAYAVYWDYNRSPIPLNKEHFSLWDETGIVADIINEAKEIPGIGLLPKIIKAIGKGRKYLKDWRTKRGNELLNALSKMEANEVEKYLPLFFAEDINYYLESNRCRLVIFIDTYEQLWGTDRTEGTRFTRDEWIRNIIEKTPGVLWVISGRMELEWPKLNEIWDERIEQRKVDDLEDEHATAYLIDCGIDDDRIRNVIIKGSKRVPLYLDISVNTFEEIEEKGRKPSPGDFGGTDREIFDSFIKSLNQPEIDILEVLAPARFWDKKIFQALINHFNIGYPPMRFKEFLRFSFVKAGLKQDTWSMHELMRNAFFKHAEKKTIEESNRFMFDYYDKEITDVDPISILEKHKTALSEAYYHAAQSLPPDELLGWFIKAADAFDRGAQWTLLAALYEELKAILQGKLGPDHLDVALTLNNLALLYKSQGRYAEAEPLFKRSLEIKEKALSPDHPDVAITLNNLASLYLSQGKYVEAEPLYKRSLEIKEKALGPDHPDVATMLNNLALLYESQGKQAEAEPLYKRDLLITEKALGPDHPDVATTLNNLALLYKSQGRYAEAEPLYKRDLQITEKALGPDHPDVAATLNNLAGLYGSQGKQAEAEPLYKRALEIWEKSFGMIHPNIATVLGNMAGLYEAMGKKEKAVKHLVRADEIRSKLQQ